ncbi:MAG: hypothetical protein RR824_09255 [Clostridia bacterium]
MPRAFLAGAVLYPMIELCYRRRTHPAMALAGGLSLSALHHIHHAQKSRPLLVQALLGGLWITGIELGVGLVFNRHYGTWDYRKTPFNLHGQICIPFTLAWCALSTAALCGMRLMDQRKGTEQAKS